MFGSIPEEKIHKHDWRAAGPVGEISAKEVSDSCGGVADWPMPILLNRMLMEEPWDLVINVGHVVPHEVLGFANHNKNYFIGLGGKDSICASHLMAARCGIENNLGNLVTPVRHCFNLAEDRLLGRLPDLYVQVVLLATLKTNSSLRGCISCDDLETYLSGREAITRAEHYRLRKAGQEDRLRDARGRIRQHLGREQGGLSDTMAMADGGELLILAPGLKRFGEQPEVDAIIRRYGYSGTALSWRVQATGRPTGTRSRDGASLARLVRRSFSNHLCTRFLTKEEIEQVHFGYADLAAMIDRYQPDQRKEGWNKTADGEEFYFIPTPSAGLWSTHDRLYNRPTGFATG